jgi:hypothetical protein
MKKIPQNFDELIEEINKPNKRYNIIVSFNYEGELDGDIYEYIEYMKMLMKRKMQPQNIENLSIEYEGL